jgi:hypothetical protein
MWASRNQISGNGRRNGEHLIMYLFKQTYSSDTYASCNRVHVAVGS